VDKVHLGTAALAAVFDSEGHITIVAPDKISAGSHPVTVSRVLPSGRRIHSNALLGKLLPTLNTATLGPLVGAVGSQKRDLSLTGKRLGGTKDDIIVALYKDDGSKVHLFEGDGTAAQITLKISIPELEFPDSGNYLVILRLNGVQAIDSPGLVWP
jgi:hypothetical protein